MSFYVKTLLLNDLKRLCVKQVENNIYIVELKTEWLSRKYIDAGIPTYALNVAWREIYKELGKCVKRKKRGKIVVFCGCF